MKSNILTLTLAAALIVLAAITVDAFMNNDNKQSSDADGHLLTALWKDYYAAEKADLPRKMSKALDAIISEAKAKRLNWDFYDAAQKKVEVESSINWKVQDSLRASLRKEIEEYGEPVVTYCFNYANAGIEQVDYVIASKARLQAAKNIQFYSMTEVEGQLEGLLPELIKDDYEFALWSEYLRNRTSVKVLSNLKDCLGDTYPNAAYFEFCQITGYPHSADVEKDLKEFIRKYDGKAISLLAKGWLLSNEMQELESKRSGQDGYKALLAECQAFEKERRTWKTGVDARIAGPYSTVEELIQSLLSKDIQISIEKDTAFISLRNLDKAAVEMALDVKNSKPILKKTIENPKKSFYVLDTVKVALPKCDDGDYVFSARNGKIESSSTYASRTLSLATREDSEALRFYAADYLTGKPADKVDLELFRSDSSVAVAKGVAIEGFTPVPESLTKKMRPDASYQIVASWRDAEGFLHKSKENYINRGYQPYYGNTSGYFCDICTDKSAFNPGETVKFKAIFYSGNFRKSLHVLDSGVKVKAEFFNAEGKSLETKELATNEYGSVAGEFKIPAGEKNGQFSIRITSDNTSSSKYVTVDEFILPTYDLTFEPVDRLFLEGDTVEVKGHLKSFSGHSLTSADVRYSIDNYGRKAGEGSVSVAQDGAFSIRFPSGQGQNYFKVNVKVSDGTGETKEFSTWVYVVDYINVDVSLVNKCEGSGEKSSASEERNSISLLSGQEAAVCFKVNNNASQQIPVPVSYEVKNASGKVLYSGTAQSGETKKFNLGASGLYSVTANASVKKPDKSVISSEDSLEILLVKDDDKVLGPKVENIFKLSGPCAERELKNGENIDVQFGASDGPVWAVVELFGDQAQLLERKMVHLEGKAGEAGSLTTISYPYKAEYPDAVLLNIFYFRNGKNYGFSRQFRRAKETMTLPLSFSSFQDKTLPGKQCSFILKSRPGVEAVAAVFDASSEKIASNCWQTVQLEGISARTVSINACDGSVGSSYYGGRPVIAYGVSRSGFKKMKLMSRSTVALAEADVQEDAVMNEAAPAPSAMAESAVPSAQADQAAANVAIRSDFSTSLAFEPFLRSDADGNIDLTFKTSDKLSTFIVQVFAHSKDMQNALVRKEMVVSVPVKVSVVEPKYLYKGDKYVLHATVSSSSETPVSGLAVLQAYSSKDYKDSKPYMTLSKKVTVPAKGSVPVSFDVNPKDFDELGFKVVFSDDAKTFSDGMFVSVPVREASQTLTESHSAVLLPGADKNALLRRLESAFTGTTSRGAEYKEVDIRQMILDAIPSKVEPQGKDILSLTEAMYVRSVAKALGAKLTYVMSDETISEKILACRNLDGGFSWFEGLKSSPVITTVVLERFAKLRDAGLLPDAPDLSSSVAYLDRNQFLGNDSWPFWCGRVSTDQYVYVRSLYASVPFNVEFEKKGDKSEYKENFKAFKEYLAGYLVPGKKDGRGMNGQILAKARRIKTLLQLVNNDGGLDLASRWGLKFAAASKMNKSMAADVESLLEYAVQHRDGGWYYPNAVMPWRGLLESELYAHSLLCDLLSDPRVASASGPAQTPSGIADGIRIWIMLQKETQKWEEDPAFVDAVNSVMKGSEALLSTKVIALTKTYRKPFSEITAAGNGFTVERHFYKEVLGADKKIGRVEVFPENTLLHVGDKLSVEYKIWNQENRSFVKLTAPREAAFRPVDQLSGYYGWWLQPIGVYGSYFISPQGYRNVKADCTEYYFDVYPEENTAVTEDFFVTQEGTFSAPVVAIESLYAPHYRANDKFRGVVKSDF